MYPELHLQNSLQYSHDALDSSIPFLPFSMVIPPSCVHVSLVDLQSQAIIKYNPQDDSLKSNAARSKNVMTQPALRGMMLPIFRHAVPDM